METTVEERTAALGGREYRHTVTRRGPVELTLRGAPALAESATEIVWPGKMGTSRSCTLSRPERTPEEATAFLAGVQEAAASALMNEGIW